jgi:hypothetical protein
MKYIMLVIGIMSCFSTVMFGSGFPQAKKESKKKDKLEIIFSDKTFVRVSHVLSFRQDLNYGDAIAVALSEAGVPEKQRIEYCARNLEFGKNGALRLSDGYAASWQNAVNAPEIHYNDKPITSHENNSWLRKIGKDLGENSKLLLVARDAGGGYHLYPTSATKATIQEMLKEPQVTSPMNEQGFDPDQNMDDLQQQERKGYRSLRKLLILLLFAGLIYKLGVLQEFKSMIGY